jgi:hypothetical protein
MRRRSQVGTIFSHGTSFFLPLVATIYYIKIATDMGYWLCALVAYPLFWASKGITLHLIFSLSHIVIDL